jgi:hypothetical protein
MYALKRIIAYSIDATIIFAIAGLGRHMLFSMAIDHVLNPHSLGGTVMAYGSIALFAGLPIIVLGTLSGLFGWTPGKLILFLRVHGRNGKAPGMAQGILRETVKYVGISFMLFGAVWALYGIITRERAFYDEWIGVDVEDLKPSGLTEIQKRWREFQRDERRGK